MIRLVWLCLGLVTSSPADAHGALAGGEGFYTGAAHPFLAWEHLLLLLVIGLLLGRSPKRNSRLPLCCLALSLLLGLISETAGLALPLFPSFVLGLGLVSGLVLAAGSAPPIIAMTTLAALTGLAVGLDTDVPALTAASGLNAYTTYIGVFAAVFLIVLNMMALSLVVKQPSLKIGLRIVGSWIAAISLMVLTLHFRGMTGAI